MPFKSPSLMERFKLVSKDAGARGKLRGRAFWHDHREDCDCELCGAGFKPGEPVCPIAHALHDAGFDENHDFDIGMHDAYGWSAEETDFFWNAFDMSDMTAETACQIADLIGLDGTNLPEEDDDRAVFLWKHGIRLVPYWEKRAREGA